MVKNIVKLMSEKNKKRLNMFLLLFIAWASFIVPIVTSKTIIVYCILLMVNIEIGEFFYYLNIINRKIFLMIITKVIISVFALRIYISDFTQLEIINLLLAYLIFTLLILLGFIKVNKR